MRFNKVIAIFSIFYFGLAYADKALSFNISEFVKNHGVVFLGEKHTLKNHKDLAVKFIEAMEKDSEIDTFAFEHGYALNQSILEEYLRDRDAGPGTIKELYYICKIGQDVGSIGSKNITYQEFKKLGKIKAEDLIRDYSYEKRICGTWQRFNFFPSSLKMFRKMREISLRSPARNYKFCPIDHWVGGVPPKTVEEFNKLLSFLDEKSLNLFHRRYGKNITQQQYEEGIDELTNAVRDFQMASNLKACMKGRKGTLVLAGAYHSQDTSHLVKGQVNQIVETIDEINNGEINSKRLGVDCYDDNTTLKKDSDESINSFTVASLFEAFKGLQNVDGDKTLGTNLVVFNRNSEDQYKKLPFFKPVREFLTQYQGSENDFVKVKMSDVPQSFKDYMREYSLGEFYNQGAYEFMLLAPATLNCSKENCKTEN